VVECVNVEHEEVVLVPRRIDCRRVTFNYGLGDEFINVLKTLHKHGLDSTEKLTVRGVEVAPRDLVAAVLPDPATLGERMSGKTCAGTLVTGTGKDGAPRSVYLYHVTDHEHAMQRYGRQAVVSADRAQPGRRARAARKRPVAGSRRPRPPGVPAAPVPRPARRLRGATRDGRGRSEALSRAPVPCSGQDRHHVGINTSERGHTFGSKSSSRDGEARLESRTGPTAWLPPRGCRAPARALGPPPLPP